MNTGKHKFKSILNELKTLLKNLQKKKRKEKIITYCLLIIFVCDTCA